MDPIKEAFSKIKEDIIALRLEIKELREAVHSREEQLSFQTEEAMNTYEQTDKQTDSGVNQTKKIGLEGLYSKNNDFSIGNEGVQTNRQTDKQTDEQTEKEDFSQFSQVKETLDSLDTLRKEIRTIFKKLTPQEMAVFSALYALEDEGFEEITYRLIANKVALSESSIRDYIQKIVKKGIPIEKTKVNNKSILLKISSDLRKTASLSTIISLRGL